MNVIGWYWYISNLFGERKEQVKIKDFFIIKTFIFKNKDVYNIYSNLKQYFSFFFSKQNKELGLEKKFIQSKKKNEIGLEWYKPLN